MKIFNYKADIIPVIIILILFSIDIFMYIIWISWMYLGIYMIFSILSKAFIWAWNHHHQHVLTFHQSILNRLLEIIYGFQTGIVWYGWVLHHNLWHHINYQNQLKDESAWKSIKGKRYNSFMYTCIVAITSYYRAFMVWNKYRNIQKYFICMCIIQVGLLFLLIFLQPLQGIVLFCIPMVMWIIITVYTTYHHHSWLDSKDHYTSSYNIITPWYNLLTGNLGYHTAHHINGSRHWSKLPEFHKTIEHKIEDKYYKRYNLLWYSNGK